MIFGTYLFSETFSIGFFNGIEKVIHFIFGPNYGLMKINIKNIYYYIFYIIGLILEYYVVLVFFLIILCNYLKQ